MVNLNDLRKKHQTLNKTPGEGNQDFLLKFFQPQEGDNIVRLLPSKDPQLPFYAETKIHRVVDANGYNKNYHCRKTKGDKCPLCDLYYALWDNFNKTGNTESSDLARQIKPRERFYLNIVDRSDTENPVKILSIGKMLFSKITETMLDPDYAEIFEECEDGLLDPQIGHDFKINKKMEAGWPKYDQSMFRPKANPLGSKKFISEVMESLHDIHNLVKVEEYDTLVEVAQTLAPHLVRKERTLSDTDDEAVSDEDYERNLRL